MTSSRTLAVALVALAALAPHAEAQRLEPRPVPTNGVESFTFQSPSMGVRFGVNVGAPMGYQPGATRKYPALVVTDGDWAFPAVLEAVRRLGQQGAIDGMFVISIGTTLDDGDSTWTRRRVYEFSPPDWDMKDPFGQFVAAGCKSFHSPLDRCVGGAPRFLNAITAELLPMVTSRYPVDAAQLGLYGVSAGGFFASWTLFQPASPFKKYLISSPAMAYGDREVFRQEERYASDHKDLPVAVYFGAGSLEVQDAELERVGLIVSGMTHLAGVLTGRKYPGLRMLTELHPGVGHIDGIGTVAVHGLRFLYGK